MAQISADNMNRIEKRHNNVHDRVYATWSAFELAGKKYIQIDTYGSIGREYPEKVSQSIQLDRDTAAYLVSILRDEFALD